MNCSKQLLSIALALAVAAPLGAYFRHPTSDDFLSPPDKTCHSPAPSPDGRSIAYVVEDSGLKQIWLRVLGRPPVDKKVSDGQSNDDSPDWSPDGSRIYFSSDRGGTSKIWMLDVARGTRKQVTGGLGQDFHPRLSPSGRQLAYDSNRGGNYDVWIRELATGEDRKLTDAAAGDFSPCWSPRGDELAFTSSRGGQFHIWIQDAAGRNPARQLTTGKGGNAHPDWSPDGRLIAFDSDRGGATKVWVQPVHGPTEPLAVTELLSVEERPRFTKTGKRIWFGAKENQLAGYKAKPAPAIDPARQAGRKPVIEPVLAAPPTPRASRFAGDRGKGSGLTVLQFFPAATQKGGVKPGAPIGAVLDKRLEPEQDLKACVKIYESTAPMSLEVSYNPSLRRIEILPDLPLRPQTEYRVVISKELLGAGGESLGEPFAWSFTTAPRAAPQRAEEPAGSFMHVGLLNKTFTLAESKPKDRSGGVRPEAKVQAGFSLPVDPKSLDVNSLRLYTAAGQSVPGELYFPPGDYVLQLTPYEPLQPGTVYEVRVSNALKSQEGDKLQGPLAWRFRTAYSGPLRVVGIQPDRVLGEHPTIRLRFNRPVSRRTLAPGKVALQGKDFPYPGAVTLSSGNELLTFEPYQKLPDKQQFVLYLPVGLTDADGNALELSGPITFNTDHQAAAKAPAPPKSKAPVNMAQNARPQVSPGLLLAPPRGQMDPAEPWVVRELAALAEKGHIDRDFETQVELHGGRLSRYKCALYVQKALLALPYMKPRERQRVEKLAPALGAELASLGVNWGPAIAARSGARRPAVGRTAAIPEMDLSG